MLKDLETTLPLQKIQIMSHSSISYEQKKRKAKAPPLAMRSILLVQFISAILYGRVQK